MLFRSLYFDKEAGLPVKCDTKIMEPGGKEASLEFFFSEHKDIGGVKHFMKLMVRVDGKETVEFELSELKLNEKLDDSQFAKP